MPYHIQRSDSLTLKWSTVPSTETYDDLEEAVKAAEALPLPKSTRLRVHNPETDSGVFTMPKGESNPG